MDKIIKSLQDDINRLLNDGNRSHNWDNEVKCSESIKNLCIAYSCLTGGKLNGN